MAGQDRFMNDFAAAMDAAYMYAEDINGNQVKIKKSDLLSGLFQDRGVYEGDMNNLKLSGIYYINGLTTNSAGVTGLALIFYSYPTAFQEVIDVFSGVVKKRVLLYNNGAWDKWSVWS